MLSPLEVESIRSIYESDVVRILQELIRARSDFPPGDTRAAVGVVEQELENAGISSQCFAMDPVRQSLLAEIGVMDADPVLLFHAHIDTVPSGDFSRWTYSPFEGSLSGDCVYGRGAGDAKGSVAAQLAAFLALARSGMIRKGRIMLAIVADEESGGEFGTRWLHDDGKLAADVVVIGEQTNNQISIAERVACGIDLTVYGKSAHGAMPWEGENAVLKTCRAIAYLFENLTPRLEARKHPYLPAPTLNVGRIQGGIQWSIVPEVCMVEMDRRLIPGETREAAMQEIEAILDQFNEHVEPLNYSIFSEGDVALNVDTDPKDPFIQVANSALSDLVGEERSLIGYVQTSDGRWFAKDGIPILHFGPGDPALAHAADEYVPVQQLVEAAQFLTLFGLRWQNLVLETVGPHKI
jgi:succinyl-diaminopimelate desuccinylase